MRIFAVLRVEKYQVPGAQFLHADEPAETADLVGTVRQLDAERMTVDMVDESAAIESGIGGTAAISIGRAEQAFSI